MRWTPAIAAVALLATVVLAGAAGGLGGDDGGDGGGGPNTSAEAVPTAAPVEYVATTAPIVKTRLTRPLMHGLAGDDVRAVQERLKAIGFDPGPIDGQFGDLTRAAVWAYEKLVRGVPRDEATGVVTKRMWQRMQDPVQIKPRRPNAGTPNHTEIYLPEQVLVIFQDDKPALISHISSGDGKEWCDEVTISPGEYGNEDGTEPLKKGECGVSTTPGGVYQFYRRVKGVRESALGGMLNPVYFNYGIAIHGAYNVPMQPASHGCIRIPNALSERMQSLVALGDEVYVFDGVKEPEEYGNQPPRFNWPDPNYTTTTSTTTTTTTEPPATDPPATDPPATDPPAPPSPTTAEPAPRRPRRTTTSTATVPETTLPPDTSG
jgi:hypothetical protein